MRMMLHGLTPSRIREREKSSAYLIEYIPYAPAKSFHMIVTLSLPDAGGAGGALRS
jgi:hypothetical protein